MLELGHSWAGRIGGGAVVFLDGDLGAGKTTLARGILRGMGHHGAVTSPTYTLVEHYAPGGRDVYHFDLYRLEDPAELEMTGLRDLLDGRAILLVEWPQRGAGRTPASHHASVKHTMPSPIHNTSRPPRNRAPAPRHPNT